MKRVKFIIIGVILLVTSQATALAAPKIVWLRSGSTSGFWPVVERILKATASDLDIELDIQKFHNDPTLMIKKAELSLSNQTSKPDCILFHNYKKRGEAILKLAEKHQVYAFVFNAGFPAETNVGAPREKYPMWIGQMYPDDEYAGYILAYKLYQAAKKMKKIKESDQIHMVALEGNRTSEASNARVRGLKRALAENNRLVNLQFFHSKWKESLAMDAFSTSIVRYPTVDIFWTASDNMAIGVIKAAQSAQWHYGVDYVTGGVDLLPQNQEYLKSGKMAVSVGGHYAEGAWALIMIYDFLNGYDFKNFGSTTIQTRMSAQTSSDYALIGDLRNRLREENLRKIDFKRLTRTHNPNLNKYHFKIEALFDEM